MPQMCEIQPGRYDKSDLLWFYRGERHVPVDQPFPSREMHTDYCRHRMLQPELHLSLQGKVHIEILQPTRWGWSDMSLMGSLIWSREDSDSIELFVENCGKFYLRKGAKPTGTELAPGHRTRSSKV